MVGSVKNGNADVDRHIKYVIVDTDMGSDDAWALSMILHAEKLLPNIKILGITCVHGNSTLDNVILNTRRVLERANRNDVPIFAGAVEALIPGPSKVPPFHGQDGMADLGDEYYNSFNMQSIVQPENAVEAIRMFAQKYPKKVTLLCLGPLTNIALALKTYRGLNEQFESIFLMGGNYHGIGNTSRCAEYNFHTDPESANIVLNCAKCPITILPWEACLEDKFHISMDWRWTVVGGVDNKFVQYLNAVERKLYTEYDTWMVCDALLMAVFLFPQCIRKERLCHATVELAGQYTRGQVVIDHLQQTSPNVNIIEVLCTANCEDALLWTADPDKVPQMHKH